MEAHQFRRQRGQPGIPVVGPTELDHDILAFGVAGLAQSCAERGNEQGRLGRGDKT